MNRNLILGILALLLGGTANSQEVLTLQQCREMALKNNKEMSAAMWQTKSAEYTAKSFKANFFPNFAVGGMGGYSNANGTFALPLGSIPISILIKPGLTINHTFNLPDMNLEYKLNGFYAAGVSVEQPIYMGGKIISAYKMSKLGREMARFNEALTANEVIVATDEAYALLIKAREMKKVAESYHAVLQELMKNVESAHKHGLKAQNDILKVQVKLNESELGMRKAENAVRLASMNLCHFIGMPLTSDIVVSEELPAVSSQLKTQTADITLRPEYSLLSKKVQIAQQQVKLSRSAMLPQIGVRGSYDYMNGLKINDRKLFDNGGFTVLLNVSIPIFHFGERVNKVKAAKMKLEQARMEQENLNEKMLLELTLAANNLDEAKLEAEIMDRSFSQAEENMRISKGQYEAGLETLSDHLEAQALWQQAYATKVDACFQLYITYIKYLKAAGELYQ